MKKLILVLLPFSAMAGGPAASARNPELLLLEGVMIGFILLVLGSEYGLKWLAKRRKEKKEQEAMHDHHELPPGSELS